LKSQPSISIIPNPADDKIEVIINDKMTGICRIEILNAVGNLVWKTELDCKVKSKIINTSSFKPSIYLVKIIAPDGIFFKSKLIIVR